MALKWRWTRFLPASSTHNSFFVRYYWHTVRRCTKFKGQFTDRWLWRQFQAVASCLHVTCRPKRYWFLFETYRRLVKNLKSRCFLWSVDSLRKLAICRRHCRYIIKSDCIRGIFAIALPAIQYPNCFEGGVEAEALLEIKNFISNSCCAGWAVFTHASLNLLPSHDCK